VATPLLVEELGKQGLSHSRGDVRIGSISSLGVLAYALANCFYRPGGLLGGRRNFLIGVGGAAVFTLLSPPAHHPNVHSRLAGNRLTQSLGWAGLIKVSSRWFDYSSYGSIIASQHQLPGRDAAARQQMGMLIERGYGGARCSCSPRIVPDHADRQPLWFASPAPTRDTRRQSRTRSTCLRRRVAACQCRRAACCRCAQRAFLLVCCCRSPER